MAVPKWLEHKHCPAHASTTITVSEPVTTAMSRERKAACTAPSPGTHVKLIFMVKRNQNDDLDDPRADSASGDAVPMIATFPSINAFEGHSAPNARAACPQVSSRRTRSMHPSL